MGLSMTRTTFQHPVRLKKFERETHGEKRRESPEGREGGARLLGRARHLDHHSLVARELRMRSRAMIGDVGQGGDYEGLRKKAPATGASQVYGEDLREEFNGGQLVKAAQARPVDGGKILPGN